jgi:hypothetical protein
VNHPQPRLAFCLLLAATSLSVSATTPVVKQLTPAATAQVKQRLAPAFAAQLEQRKFAFRQAATDAELAFKALAPERARLDKLLAADPRYQAYVAQVQRIGAGTADVAEKSRRIGELARANRAVFDDALRAAKIDRARIQSRITRGTLTENLSLRIPLNLTLPAAAERGSSVPSTPSTPDPASLPRMVVLEPPYDYESQETDNGGLAAQAASASVVGGQARAHSSVIGLVGEATSNSDIGTTITVPEGVGRMRVTAHMEGSYSVAAASAISASTSCANFELQVVNASQGHTFRSASEGECVSATLAWFADASGAYTKNYVASVYVPTQGREFLILASAFAWGSGAGAPGYANASARVKPNRITVEYFYN